MIAQKTSSSSTNVSSRIPSHRLLVFSNRLNKLIKAGSVIGCRLEMFEAVDTKQTYQSWITLITPSTLYWPVNRVTDMLHMSLFYCK